MVIKVLLFTYYAGGPNSYAKIYQSLGWISEITGIEIQISAPTSIYVFLFSLRHNPDKKGKALEKWPRALCSCFSTFYQP